MMRFCQGGLKRFSFYICLLARFLILQKRKKFDLYRKESIAIYIVFKNGYSKKIKKISKKLLTKRKQCAILISVARATDRDRQK